MPRASRRRRMKRQKRQATRAILVRNLDLIRCWCGAVGTYEELFDDDPFCDTCGGTGGLDCHCGGDFCICHHHGTVECPGCDECESDEDHDDWFDDEDY